jgi:hypothetical protein
MFLDVMESIARMAVLLSGILLLIADSSSAVRL